MPTYVVPQVLVFQEFTRTPNAFEDTLFTHISGPHAHLVRFEEESERELGWLGYYDRLSDTVYSVPNLPTRAVVDKPSSVLWVKNALLHYFTDAVGSGSVINRVSGSYNKIRSNSVNFADYPGYPRSVGLCSDVRVGDVIYVSGLDSSNNVFHHWSKVKALHNEIINSVIGTPSGDPNNAASQTANATSTQSGTNHNDVDIDSINITNYDGLTSGYITDVYTIEVIQSSTGGNATTAILKVTSVGGDNVPYVVPSAFGSPTDIGTRGLRVTFINGNNNHNFLVGQKWTVTVQQAFTAPTVTAGGSYDSFTDTIYVIEVIKGGDYSATRRPIITVTTNNGVDISGPHTLNNPGPHTIGTRGVTITFSGPIRKNDKYYIPVTGKKYGPVRIIEMLSNLPDNVPASSDLRVELYKLKPAVKLSRERWHAAPLLNFDVNVNTNEVTVYSGIEVFDQDCNMHLPLYSNSQLGYGGLYLEYRAWLSNLADSLYTVQDIDELNTLVSGPLVPANPLKWALLKALQNSNGVPVKFTAVANPDDPNSWNRVLEIIGDKEETYNLVPLTKKREILDLYQAHVNNNSSPEQGLWRVLWVNLKGVPVLPIVHAGSNIEGYTTPTTSDGLEALCTIDDDPSQPGTQYVRVTCTSNNALFVTNGVRPGDLFRTSYTTDGFGNSTYTEYKVHHVVSEQTLILVSGPNNPITIPTKFEIWRNLNATEEAEAIARAAKTWNDRRVRAVWPDLIGSGNVLQEGYFLCAALAALSSSVLPHQPLTNVEIKGFDDVSRTYRKFSRTQLNTMAGSGVWIVTQDIQTGKIYTRHALTTADYNNINDREETVVKNVDSISFRFKRTFAPYIGNTNVTGTALERLKFITNELLRVLATEKSTPLLGGQIVGGEILEFRRHTIFRDRFVVTIRLDLPYPLNNLDIYLVV